MLGTKLRDALLIRVTQLSCFRRCWHTSRKTCSLRPSMYIFIGLYCIRRCSITVSRTFLRWIILVMTCQTGTDRMYVEVSLYPYKTFTLEVGWSAQCPGLFTSEKRRGTHPTGSYMSMGAGFDASEVTRSHRGLNPGPSNPNRFAVPTMLSWPIMTNIHSPKQKLSSTWRS
jgi:hypothetical protein